MKAFLEALINQKIKSIAFDNSSGTISWNLNFINIKLTNKFTASYVALQKSLLASSASMIIAVEKRFNSRPWFF